MSPWRWVDQRSLVLLQDESLAEHGGASGIRDEGALKSALARPRHLIACEEPDLARLAAAYGVGLAKNHPFVDGNKRAAFLAVGLFLALNGQRLVVGPAEATLTMFAVAASGIDELAFADWIRTQMQSRQR
jgi:death-on-curing protein